MKSINGIISERFVATNPCEVRIIREPCSFRDSIKRVVLSDRNANKDYDGFEEWEKHLIGKVELPKQGGTKMFEYTIYRYVIIDNKCHWDKLYSGTNRKEAAEALKIANEDLGGHIDIRLLWKEETRDERLWRIWEEKVRAEREALRKP